MMGYVSSAPGSFEYNFGYPALVNAVVSNPSYRDSFNNLEPQAGEVMSFILSLSMKRAAL